MREYIWSLEEKNVSTPKGEAPKGFGGAIPAVVGPTGPVVVSSGSTQK